MQINIVLRVKKKYINKLPNRQNIYYNCKHKVTISKGK